MMSHWTQAEVELIIGWMEENPHLLRGKQHEAVMAGGKR